MTTISNPIRWLRLAALSLVLTSACKRQTSPELEEVWDEEPAESTAEALDTLSPLWGAPVRAQLEDGLVSFWLTEADAPRSHVRLLLPLSTDERATALGWVAADHLEHELERTLKTAEVEVAVESRPGRLEIVAHGPSPAISRMLSRFGVLLGDDEPQAALERARARVARRIAAPTAEELATARLVAAVLGVPKEHQRVDKAELQALSARDLVEGWRMLTDPRRAVLIVHASASASDAKAWLRSLSSQWRGHGRRKVVGSAVERLRGFEPRPVPKGRPLGEPATPLLVAGEAVRGRPLVVLGRAIPTAKPEDRTFARLAQRVLQEEIDVRVTLAGDFAIVTTAIEIDGRDPEAALRESMGELSALARTRHQRQHLLQAARLWLGARVVQASLGGEDWTSLFSEAMDLAGTDAEIGQALARDAGRMLQSDPERLQAWTERWLDPQRGEVGWVWVGAGLDDKTERQLARTIPMQR